MRWTILGAIALIFIPQLASAQNENLDIVDKPICFAIVNQASYKTLGTLATGYYFTPEGTRTRHRSNFRLDSAGSINEETSKPSDRVEFCSYGPFLPNRQLELTLRSLWPIFTCETRIDQGEIVIKGERNAEDTGVDTWAECYQADGTKTGKPPKK